MVKSILLIDDDFATNYLHQLMLEQLKMVKNIFIVDNGKQALDILFDKQNKPKLVPDLILLYLNMPLMDGWSFINEYKKYVPATKSNIIMITSSLNPKDQ
ncbi:MAG: response regulator [Marinilabiliales bacterium]|nr:MAG: response regulator [Marinilabiliales bacterium]